MTLPSWLRSTPWWTISRARDGGNQKYKNHRGHCLPFEKKHPGKSPGERKTTILDAAIITLGYPLLSLGIYQWAPCLGFDPQLLHKSQANKGRGADLPLLRARSIPGQQTNTNLQ